MGAMSASHWLIVLLVVVLLFGPKKLPTLGKSLGEGMRALRDGLSTKDENKPAVKDSEKKQSTNQDSNEREDDSSVT